jgi:hypothetical protein
LSVAHFADLSSHVILPKSIAKQVPKDRLMSEEEWRRIGVMQSRGWVHYMHHKPGGLKRLCRLFFLCVCVPLLFLLLLPLLLLLLSMFSQSQAPFLVQLCLLFATTHALSLRAPHLALPPSPHGRKRRVDCWPLITQWSPSVAFYLILHPESPARLFSSVAPSGQQQYKLHGDIPSVCC